jgi:hypothetical protein
MFHFCAVPFTCPYQPDLSCPVSVILSERDPDHTCVTEAIPCQCCPHFLAQAQQLWAQRRVEVGTLGRQLLTLAREQGTTYFPLTATLRTQLAQRVDLHRLRKAVQTLAGIRALRTFRFPAAVPRADNPQHLVLRETLWVQVTAVGEILAEVPGGRHGPGWRKQDETLVTHFRIRYEHLCAIDLFSVYVEQVVAIVTAVTQELVAATDTVMIAHCTGPESPYVDVFVHLDAIAPDACARLQQMYLHVQEARQRAVTFCHAALRQHRTGPNAPPGPAEKVSGYQLGHLCLLRRV